MFTNLGLAACCPQDAVVRALLRHAAASLKATLRFRSVHAAALQPGRAVAWLEGAAKLPVAERVQLLELFPLLLEHQRPALGGIPETAEAPGLVAALQWKEGALQLQQEVSHRVHVTVTVTVLVTMLVSVTGKVLAEQCAEGAVQLQQEVFVPLVEGVMPHIHQTQHWAVDRGHAFPHSMRSAAARVCSPCAR
jgi:hypothetical protein